MIILGLTGSIGMGKTTTARLFRDFGIPVSDADEVVHNLYSGPATPLIERLFPGTTMAGAVDRGRLSERLSADPGRFKELEAIVHPLVRKAEDEFVDIHRQGNAPLIVLDIPLLFEVGAEERVDKIAAVSTTPDIQRSRVLHRPGMTPEKFELILSRQLPDVEKRRRANFIIDTGQGIEHARTQVSEIIAKLINPWP